MTISSQLKLSCNNLFFVHSKSLLDISDMIKLNIKSSLVFNAKDWMLSNLWRLLCYYFSLTKQEQKYETLNDHSLNPCAFHQLNMFVYFRILTIIYLSLSLSCLSLPWIFVHLTHTLLWLHSVPFVRTLCLNVSLWFFSSFFNLHLSLFSTFTLPISRKD